MVSLIALLVNVLLLSILPTSLIWPIFICLTTGHLWANYQAKRCILFGVFNHQRFHLVCSEYLQTNGREILSIQHANDREAILFQPSLPYRLHLGLSLDQIPQEIFPTEARLATFHNSEHERFLLMHDRNAQAFYALLKPNADNDDLIRLNFYIELFSYVQQPMLNLSSQGIHQVMQQIQHEQFDFDQSLRILSKANDQYYQQFKRLCLEHGYNFHHCLFHLGVFRIQ